MSEWAKRQACWNGLKGRKLDYGAKFDGCLVLKETSRSNERDQKDKDRAGESISALVEVVNRGGEYWRNVQTLGLAARKLTLKDEQILQVCASMPRQLPSELQAKHAMSIREKMKNYGLIAE